MFRHKSGLIPLLATLFCLTQVAVLAQETSPYSRFGIGLVGDNNFIQNSSMGGLGAAYRSDKSYNFNNPASLSAMGYITMEAGMDGYNINRKTTLTSSKVSGANFKYLALTFPVTKYWSTSTGLIPFSQKDYYLSDTIASNGQRGISEYEGSGGLYNFYWGNGFKWKDLSLGLNVAYLFGNISNNVLSYPLDDNGNPDYASFAAWSSKSIQVKSFYWNAGAQYTLKLKEKDSVTTVAMILGLSGNPRFKIGDRSVQNASLYSVDSRNLAFKNEYQSISNFFEDLLVNNSYDVDTIKEVKNEKISVTIPGYFQFGVAFTDYVHWTVGTDFRYQPWSQYQGYENNSASVLYNSWRVGVGGEYQHRAQRNYNFFSKLTYRGGFYYKRSNIEIASNPIDEFGINVGFGIPVNFKFYTDFGSYTRLMPAINFGVEAGSRGTQSAGLIRENFVRFKLGLNLYTGWALKRRYN